MKGKWEITDVTKTGFIKILFQVMHCFSFFYPSLTSFLKNKINRSTAWEHLNLQLHISGKMMDNLMREGDVAGDIIEFYILKLQNNIKKNELKQDGSPKYQRAVFISTFAYVSLLRNSLM